MARLAWAYSSPRRVRICSLSASRVSTPKRLASASSISAGFGAFTRLDGHREGRLLAGEVLGAVALGEGDLDLRLVAGLHADELLLEAGDEAARAEHQREVLGGAALEGLAVDLAVEVDHHLVAVGSALRPRPAVLEVLGRGGEVGERLVDGGVLDLATSFSSSISAKATSGTWGSAS